MRSSGSAALQRLEGGLRGLRGDLVGLVDDRAHPVGLPAFGAGGADALDQPGPALGRQRDGRHRRAARRQFVDRGHVEVGIGAHRQGPRDRRGGHDQLVWAEPAVHALLAQGQALLHAEAVLFVDDRQREVVEHHALLHQRVGADHHLRAPGRDLLQRLRPRLAGDLACEPGHLDAQRFQPGAQVGEVLLRQQFGRRHQRGLAAVGDRHQRGHRRDHGLAGADVALHQAQHRPRLAQVLAQLRVDARLRRGQRERQRVLQPRHQRLVAAQRAGALRLQGQPLPAHAEVVRQQFLHRQPPLRRVGAGLQRGEVGVGRRRVQGEDRLAQRRQAERAQPCRRQQFQHVGIGQRLQRLQDQLAQRGRADAFDCRVDRVEGVGQRVALGTKDAVAGMDQFQSVLARPRGAERTHRACPARTGWPAAGRGNGRSAAPGSRASRRPARRAASAGSGSRVRPPPPYPPPAPRRRVAGRGCGSARCGPRSRVAGAATGPAGWTARARPAFPPSPGRPRAGARAVAGGDRRRSGRGTSAWVHACPPRRQRRTRAPPADQPISPAPSPRRPRTRRPWAARRPRWWNARDTAGRSIRPSPN